MSAYLELRDGQSAYDRWQSWYREAFGLLGVEGVCVTLNTTKAELYAAFERGDDPQTWRDRLKELY